MSSITILDPDGDVLLIVHDPANMDEDGNISKHNSSAAATAGPKSNTPTPVERAQDAAVSESREFKVSSKHLILASGYFKKALNGPWREATVIHDDGLRHVRIGEFNFDAMAIILNVIHGKDSLVPRELDLRMLAEVARVVDYLQCYEVMGLYSTCWISHLQKLIPSNYNSKLLLWIFIARAFRNEAIFGTCTRIAILAVRSQIANTSLPLLPQILGII